MKKNTHECAICHKSFAMQDLVSADLIRKAIFITIQKDYPNWTQESFICHNDLDIYRNKYVHQILHKPFDPYPFIFLNLILSCLAAIQAPVIMMSQNRQEAKDRIRSKYDYKVNLKAELEIRQIHEKLDHLLSKQWERLAEMQEIQIEQLSELSELKKRM